MPCPLQPHRKRFGRREFQHLRLRLERHPDLDLDAWTALHEAYLPEDAPETRDEDFRVLLDFLREYESGEVERPPATVPSQALPGTEEKLRLLEERAGAGLQLFHPDEPQQAGGVEGAVLNLAGVLSGKKGGWKRGEPGAGVRPVGNKHRVDVCVNGVRRYLGMFDTEAAADAAAEKARSIA